MREPTQQVAWWRRLPSFVITGGMGAIVSYSVLWLFIDKLHWAFWIAYALQTFLALTVNLIGNYLWTWRDTTRNLSGWNRVRVIASFYGFKILITIPINQGLFYIQVYWFGIPYLIANGVCLLWTAFFNFFSNHNLIFRRRDDSSQHGNTEE